MINEEFLREELGVENLITGQEVADLVGAGEIYRRGKQQEMMDNQLKTETVNKFTNLINRMNEVDKKNARDIID